MLLNNGHPSLLEKEQPPLPSLMARDSHGRTAVFLHYGGHLPHPTGRSCCCVVIKLWRVTDTQPSRGDGGSWEDGVSVLPKGPGFPSSGPIELHWWWAIHEDPSNFDKGVPTCSQPLLSITQPFCGVPLVWPCKLLGCHSHCELFTLREFILLC